MVRMFLSRPLEIKGRVLKEKEIESDDSDESDESEKNNSIQRHQDLVMLNMFKYIALSDLIS